MSKVFQPLSLSIASVSCSFVGTVDEEEKGIVSEKLLHRFARSLDPLHTTCSTIALGYLHDADRRSNAHRLGASQDCARPCSVPGPLCHEQCLQAPWPSHKSGE